jgi:site-specific recombinase XerD
MGCSYKAILNKNNIRNKSGRFTVFIRITVDRRSKYFKTEEKVEEKFWSGKENKWIKDTHPFAFELNSVIRKKIHMLQQFEYRQKLFGNGISLETLSEYFHKKADPNVFNEYVAEFMKTVKGKSLNTLKKYRTFVTYLNEFNGKLSFSQLNEGTFQTFAAWLQRKGMMGVTVYKYFDPFKVICKQAVKDGYLEKDPFAHVSLGVKPTKGKRVYLEIHEISILKNVKLPPGRQDLEEIRKYWLFCFYAGFYYSDLRALTWESVKNTEHGFVIMATRYKNDNPFIAPVHRFKHAVLILRDQKGKDLVFVFPEAISEQKFNDKLKELASLAKIDKNLMNKTARHSAIQFWEAQGLETQHMAKMAGHTKESTTKEYFELSIRDINSRVVKFDFSSLDI